MITVSGGAALIIIYVLVEKSYNFMKKPISIFLPYLKYWLYSKFILLWTSTYISFWSTNYPEPMKILNYEKVKKNSKWKLNDHLRCWDWRFLFFGVGRVMEEKILYSIINVFLESSMDSSSAEVSIFLMMP